MRPTLRRAAGAVVLVFVAAVWALTLAQRFGGSGDGWLELSRFLPYPLLLVPAGLAVVGAWPLGGVARWAALATLGLVVTVGMGLSWGAGEEAGAGSVRLRLMTWNAKTTQASERPGGIEAVTQEVARQRPDIVVVQEANALRRLHEAAPSAPLLGLRHVWGEGQFLVASRYPLEACAQAGAGSLPYARCRVAAPVAFELVTVHFESPRAGLLAARHEGLEGADTWEANLALRLAQSRALAGELAGRARPLVVAGDLNAVESSDVVQRLLAAGLRDAFSAAGRGYGYTYGHTLRPAFSFLRIDHVLASREVAVLGAFTGGAAASDHRPLIADLAIGGAAGASRTSAPGSSPAAGTAPSGTSAGTGRS